MRAFFLSAFLLGFALSAFAESVPSETLTCQLSAFPRDSKFAIPSLAFHPQVLVLNPDVPEISASWKLADVDLKKSSSPYYSPWILSPLENLSDSETRIYVAHREWVDGAVSLKLNRFPSEGNRESGLSAELIVAGGWRGQFLLPKKSGSPFALQSPIRDAKKETRGFVHLTCFVTFDRRR